MEYSLNLMKNRLTALYGEDNAKRLMLTHKDNLFNYHGLAWSLGKRDIEFFNLYFLKDVYVGDGLAPLAPIHYDMWNTMQNMYVEDTHDRHAFLLPRGTGKSLTGSLSIAVWANLYEYSKYTVVASAVSDTTETFIRNIRNSLINNKRIEMAFGQMYSENLINTTDKIELLNNTMIQALSSRSTFRGKSYLGNRISLLILDDYQSEENVSTVAQMDKHWKRFSDDSANAIQKDNYKMIAMGTIICKDDFYDRLSKLPTWKHTKKKAILLDNLDEHFNKGKWQKFKEILFNTKDTNRLDNAKAYYYDNKDDMIYPMLWDSYWDCLDLALQYYENPTSFKQEMQLEFSSSVTSKFDNITYYDGEYKGNVLVIDPATSSKSTADYTAFVVGGIDEGQIKISYADIMRVEFEDYIAETIKILKEFPQIDTIIVEKQTYSGTDVLAMKNVIQRDMDIYYRNFHWINEHQTKNKDNKIDSVVGDVNMGRVAFNRTLEDSAAMTQLKEFTGTKTSPHDDFPDALSELIIKLKNDNISQNIIEVFDRSLLF